MTLPGCRPSITLRSGRYTAAIAPEAGGRLAALAWHGDDGVARPLLVGWDGGGFGEHAWPKAGAFPMLPFANRLPAEGFSFGAATVRPLCGPAGFPVHGTAHRRRWEVVDLASDGAVLALRVPAGDEGWPWAWSARQWVRLSAQGLALTMTVQNLSDEPMPIGMGWHPYHPLNGKLDAQRVAFEAIAAHALDAAGRASETFDLGMSVPAPGHTMAFSGWAGALRMPAPGGAITVRSPSTDKLVLHRPPCGQYLCAEPVTLLPGHLGDGAGGDGRLPPGDVRTLDWTCAFEPAASDFVNAPR